MSLLGSLGLPTPAHLAAARPKAAPSAAEPYAVVTLSNQSKLSFRLQSQGRQNSARFAPEPPQTLAPNATVSFKVIEPTDVARTGGDVGYTTFGPLGYIDWVVRWGDLKVTSTIKNFEAYAFATRSRALSPTVHSYTVVFKDTGARSGATGAATLDAAAEEAAKLEQGVVAQVPPAGPVADAPAADAPTAEAPQPEYAGFCKVTVDNRSGYTLVLQRQHLDNEQAHFGVAPPANLAGGRSVAFVVWSRDPEHPEIGGYVTYAFRAEPALPANPDGGYEVQLAWSGTEAGGHVSPHEPTIDLAKGGGPRAWTFTLTGPAAEFAPPQAKTSQPTLRRGDKGSDGWVEYLQQLLNLQSGSTLEVDGVFGGQTHKAVLAYQRKLKKKDKAVLDDGVVGDQTWSYLRDGAPAKPATDGRRPHSHREQGVEARWESETRAVTYHEDRDMVTAVALSVGDTDQLAGRTARFRLTSPAGVQRVVDGLIGAGTPTSRSGQGFEHLVSVEAFRELFSHDAEPAPAGDYRIEAYLPADLGGDTLSGTVHLEAPTG